MLVAEHISLHLNPLLPGMSVQQALDFMETQKVESMAVVDEDQYLGLAREASLLDWENPETLLNELPEYLLPKIYLNDSKHELDILSKISEFQIDTVPVLNADDQYMGSVYGLDFIKTMGYVLNLNTPGGILVLEMATQDYHLSQIAQIVESGDAHILSLFINHLPQSQRLRVTMHLDKDDLDSIVQTFYRYEYEVVASFFYSKYKTDLNQRYELLMRYMNI